MEIQSVHPVMHLVIILMESVLCQASLMFGPYRTNYFSPIMHSPIEQGLIWIETKL